MPIMQLAISTRRRARLPAFSAWRAKILWPIMRSQIYFANSLTLVKTAAATNAKLLVRWSHTLP